MLLNIVGHVTDTDHNLCIPCAAQADLYAYRVGSAATPITDPSPQGIYRPGLNSDRYDRACDVCGWPIRRNNEGEN
jgi:hypothetical protein